MTNLSNGSVSQNALKYFTQTLKAAIEIESRNNLESTISNIRNGNYVPRTELAPSENYSANIEIKITPNYEININSETKLEPNVSTLMNYIMLKNSELPKNYSANLNFKAESVDIDMNYTGDLNDVLGFIEKFGDIPKLVRDNRTGNTTNVTHGGTNETRDNTISHELTHKEQPLLSEGEVRANRNDERLPTYMDHMMANKFADITTYINSAKV